MDILAAALKRSFLPLFASLEQLFQVALLALAWYAATALALGVQQAGPAPLLSGPHRG
jgi:hypothetical protein